MVIRDNSIKIFQFLQSQQVFALILWHFWGCWPRFKFLIGSIFERNGI